jgi:hypothetical protein
MPGCTVAPSELLFGQISSISNTRLRGALLLGFGRVRLLDSLATCDIGDCLSKSLDFSPSPQPSPLGGRDLSKNIGQKPSRLQGSKLQRTFKTTTSGEIS